MAAWLARYIWGIHVTLKEFVFMDANNFLRWYVRDPASYRDLNLFKGEGVHWKHKQFSHKSRPVAFNHFHKLLSFYDKTNYVTGALLRSDSSSSVTEPYFQYFWLSAKLTLNYGKPESDS